MVRFVALSLLLLIGYSSSGLAQSGTPKEQAACRPDVARLCRDVPPLELAVLACLKSNRYSLSDACRKVLESHGQ